MDEEPHDRVIAAVASRQHGLISRQQLFALGLGRGAVDKRLRRGRLHRIRQAVYAVGHPLLTRAGTFMAAVLTGGPDAVLSHLSAAAHYGIRQDNRPTIDVTVPRALHRRPGITWHRHSLAEDETTIHDGIPITTVPRTLFDLAALKGRPALERGMHEAEVRRLRDALSLIDLLERYPTRPGARVVREVLASGAGPAPLVNDFEEDFYAFLIAMKLPIPVFNQPLQVDGRSFRPDCRWDEQRLLAELDGRDVHESTRNREADKERDRLLMIAGWRTTRVTWRQLHHEPQKLARQLRALLR